MPEIAPSMPQNNPTGKHVRTRSTFPLQYRNFDTFRYGEYHPHFVMEGVADDKNIRLRSSHDLRSYTLQAPLMEDISMKKDYFNVPMTAILPKNWDKFFANPVIGEDAPSDCGPSMSGFYAQVNTLCQNLTTRLRAFLASGASQTDVQVVTSILRYLVITEYFFSCGSLLSSLGVHTYEYYVKYNTNNVRVLFDDIFDSIVSVLNSQISQLYLTDSNNTQYTVYMGSDPDLFSTRDLLQLFRDDPACSVGTVTFASGSTLATLRSAVLALMPVVSEFNLSNVARPFNISRIAAYQLVCSHFYTNDSIDFIFDANRYRQLIWHYYENLEGALASLPARYFTMNGLRFDYDSFSGHVLATFLQYLVYSSSQSLLYGTLTYQIVSLSYLSSVFAYRKTLRFKDYFTGSHSQPLAVADSSFDVSNASVIDITKNIQKQRFLNAVNRVGASLQDYYKEIFGTSLAPDYTNPFYLGHTSDVIFGSEVENTGDAQQSDGNSITSNLRSNGSRYEFSFAPERDCIIIGITYFDIARAYTKTIDRQTMHFDRFDWFNPYMQFIGDQEVYFEELNPDANGSQTSFAYQLRHMEYKQRFNVAQGGFIKALKGWAFLADLKFNWIDHINPDFIRSLNSELDRFYTSLTGWSNGNYFHFIVKNTNDCVASRPMAYAPSIL